MENSPDQIVKVLEKLDVGNDDEGDAGCSFYKKNKKIGIAKMPVEGKYARYYNMDHEHRGIAVILNHENFMEHQELPRRKGTYVDKERLERTWTRLGFIVKSYDDLTHEEIIKVIKEVRRMDHTNNDCFVLVCLTHGDQGLLYAYDAPYKAETLWNPFTADKCLTLAGKPKMFFIQACQGDKLDGGVILRKTIQTDGNVEFMIPAISDFLITFSTIPATHPSLDDKPLETLIKNKELRNPLLPVIGESSKSQLKKPVALKNPVKHENCIGHPSVEVVYQADDKGFYSWRNEERGSWYMEALCKILDENAYNEDLMTLLTFVNQKVSVDYQSRNLDPAKNNQKQQPVVGMLLNRLIQFREKNYATESSIDTSR